jgi:hypothetical protein
MIALYNNGFFGWDGILGPDPVILTIERARELAILLATMGIYPCWISLL